MFRRKHKIEVVPENQYTDFSERLENDKSYATNRTLIGAATVPLVAASVLAINKFTNTPETYSITSIPVAAPVIQAPIPVLQTPAPVYSPIDLSSTPEMIPTGFVADATLDTLAKVLDPVLEILRVISLPIASVIMVGACFLLMFGNSEKALSMIMSAGLGYVIIQMSPLFLEILREIGNAM